MSMQQRDSFIFYRSFYEAIKDLDDTDQLNIYKAIIEYGLNGEISHLEGITKSLFTLIKPQLDANSRRYENGKKGAQHGKKGGRPKKDVSIENPNETPNENENNNININGNENNNQKENININTIEDIYNLYPSICPNRKTITGKTERNKGQIKELLKTLTVDQIKETIQLYVKSCAEKKIYIKNFGTFLDEFPDLSELKELDTIYDDDTWCEWEVLKPHKFRKNTYKQYLIDQRRYGVENVKFIGKVR
ncbi:DUF6291 domain-containing protein [Prevotella sp. 10(H)]|uniref:DUF6291 domain-containing protein n=1 Tax=Prevotella sp. 10(H) TaxID=1158294 RepID=UPI00068CEEE9|nr:DUF6291 domain-containing protein [Prevotella sp. 10(H)]